MILIFFFIRIHHAFTNEENNINNTVDNTAHNEVNKLRASLNLFKMYASKKKPKHSAVNLVPALLDYILVVRIERHLWRETWSMYEHSKF